MSRPFFHFYRGRRDTIGKDNMTDTSNVTNIHNGHEFVDLGLPSGLLWTTCNVVDNSPEQVTAGERKFSQNIYDAGSAASISTNLTL